MTNLRLAIDSTVRLTDKHGVHKSFYVRKRLKNGFLFEPYDLKEERHFHSDESVIEHYVQGRMSYSPTDETHMSNVRRERLRKTWDGMSRAQKIVAERREAIVIEVNKQICLGRPICEVLAKVPAEVVALHVSQWETEDYAIAYKAFEDEKDAGVKQSAGAEPKHIKPFAVPCARTVWEWTSRYMEMSNNVIALVRYDDKKGRRNQLDVRVIEALAAFITGLSEANQLRLSDSALYRKLEDHFEGLGLVLPSRVTFVKRLRKAVTGYDLIAARKGKRAAEESKKIAEYVPDPKWALAQVEIDHTLANIHLVCDITGHTLGRPWITVVLDRLTRIILGCHISFLPPSWATLSRAIAHAIWIKDLSHLPGQAGLWDYHGVFDWAYTDRGMDFISHAGRRAGTFVGFDFANLPGYSPWLKGKIERCFRTLALQCYDYLEGLTSFNDPTYNPRKNAEIQVSQSKGDLIKWIINYNHRERGGHSGNRSPDDIWKESIESIGGVRPVPTVSSLRRMMGQSAYPMIGNHGMKILGLEYNHPRMEELRTYHDIVGRRFEVRFDPFDLGAVDFFDGNEWLTADCRRPDIAAGVTRWQNRFHQILAEERAKNGVITADLVASVKAQAETDYDLLRHQFGRSKIRTTGSQLARYLDQGQFLTPLRFTCDRPIAPPLQIPGAMLLEDGRFLVPPRPNFENGPSHAPLMISGPTTKPKVPKPKADNKSGQQNSDTAPDGIAAQQQSERLRARLEESRKSRGAQ